VVSTYLQGVLAARADTVRNLAVANRILIQAEEEGRQYMMDLLRELGRPDVVVRFEGEDVQPSLQQAQSRSGSTPPRLRQGFGGARVDEIQFGFVPF
jgi:hypothetical protein